MRNKRFFTFLLMVSIVLSLVGCSSRAGSPAQPTDSPATEPADQSSSSAPTDPSVPTAPSDTPAPTDASNPTEHVHNFKPNVRVEPSCTQEGFLHYICTCGREKCEYEAPPTGHDFRDWLMVIEPTPFEEGKLARSCRKCGDMEVQVVAKLPLPELDYAAAVDVGNEYAVSKYGWIVNTTLNYDNAFHFSCGKQSLKDIVAGAPEGHEAEGLSGQAYLEWHMKHTVDELRTELTQFGSTDGYKINCNCYLDESSATVYIFAYYALWL